MDSGASGAVLVLGDTGDGTSAKKLGCFCFELVAVCVDEGIRQRVNVVGISLDGIFKWHT